jgi:hypothetical protein
MEKINTHLQSSEITDKMLCIHTSFYFIMGLYREVERWYLHRDLDKKCTENFVHKIQDGRPFKPSGLQWDCNIQSDLREGEQEAVNVVEESQYAVTNIISQSSIFREVRDHVCT